jgi:hypothetical protein
VDRGVLDVRGWLRTVAGTATEELTRH